MGSVFPFIFEGRIFLFRGVCNGQDIWEEHSKNGTGLDEVGFFIVSY